MDTCKNCQQQFEIRPQDHEFYKKINWPAPKNCPDCRRQKRFAIRNERNLHRRQCDNCDKKIISVYPQDSQYIVDCNECWYQDNWDPLDYGRDYDFSRPFFEQYAELEKEIPHFAIFQEGENQNCEFINYGVGNKSCYLSFCAYSEDIYFSYGVVQSKSCVDCLSVTGCELCYECIDCKQCYNLQFSKDSYNCSDSQFLEDCIGCANCFCSAGLRNKQYVFENQQLSKQEYQEKISEIKLTTENIKNYYSKLKNLSLKIPKKHYHGKGNENVVGDYIENSKDLYECFDIPGGLNNCAYCNFSGIQSHYLYDAYAAGVGSQFSTEVNGVTNLNNCKCIYYARSLQDSEYCQVCFNSEHLFGCFGLKHKKYCILNKQYSKEEYKELYKKIVTHMKETGEYGEFFPIKNSPVFYNESIAFPHYPLTKEEALQKGYPWRDRKASHHNLPNLEVCKTCNKQFKLIDQEKAFYKKHNIPSPEDCPECRHQNRFTQHNSLKLYSRNCQKCQTSLKTTYSPDRPEIVYCEECYLAEVQ